jgi:hypothetical protein
VIPEKLKVLGKYISIDQVDKIDDDDNILGIWKAGDRKIELRNDEDTDLPEIFLHEIIECINDRCDLGLTHNKISTLSEILFQVIDDNKLDFRRSDEQRV